MHGSPYVSTRVFNQVVSLLKGQTKHTYGICLHGACGQFGLGDGDAPFKQTFVMQYNFSWAKSSWTLPWTVWPSLVVTNPGRGKACRTCIGSLPLQCREIVSHCFLSVPQDNITKLRFIISYWHGWPVHFFPLACQAVPFLMARRL